MTYDDLAKEHRALHLAQYYGCSAFCNSADIMSDEMNGCFRSEPWASINFDETDILDWHDERYNAIVNC